MSYWKVIIREIKSQSHFWRVAVAPMATPELEQQKALKDAVVCQYGVESRIVQSENNTKVLVRGFEFEVIFEVTQISKDEYHLPTWEY